MPAGISWPLPLYELALLTAVHLADSGADVELQLVTPEPRPLQLFGDAASEVVVELLDRHGIGLRTDTIPAAVEGNVLRFVGTGEIEADRVVALPRIEGLRLPGIPHDANGFVPIDEHGRVRDVEDVYAAGDLTNFPIKQGGLAAQQADAAAEAIAAAAGAEITPTPFTAGSPRPAAHRAYSALHARRGRQPRVQVDTEPLWWPPGKIVGRHLAPFLACPAERLADASALGRPRGRSRGRPWSGRRVGVDLSLGSVESRAAKPRRHRRIRRPAG